MISSEVKNLIKASQEDELFLSELKVHEPKNYKIGLFWSDMQKITYSAIYMGWLIGKGSYNESNY